MSVPDQALPQTSQVTGPIRRPVKRWRRRDCARRTPAARGHPRVTHAVSPCVHDERGSLPPCLPADEFAGHWDAVASADPAHGQDSAEVGLLVADAWQGQGTGRTVLAHIAGPLW